MLGRQPLVAAAQRHCLRRLEETLRAIGVFFDVHNPNLVSCCDGPAIPSNSGATGLVQLLRGTRPAPVLNGYRYVIYHRGHSRRLPGSAFGLLAFRPGSHSAFEDYLASVCLDGDPARIDLGTAPEGFFNLAFDLGRLGAWLQLDRVDHASDAFEPAHCPLGLLALVIP